MISFRKLVHRLEVNNSKDKFFLIILFLINLISATSVTVWYCNTYTLFSICLTNSTITFLEYWFCSLFSNKIKRVLGITLLLISALLLTIDWGCRFLFNKVLSFELIDILSETNLSESLSFCSTYFLDIALGLIASIVILAILYVCAKWLIRLKYLTQVLFISAICGFFYISYAGYNLILYRNGMSITTYSTLTRLFYATYVSKSNAEANLKVLETCRKVKATKINSEESPNFIVVIGESFSYFHTPLYGYNHNTSPFLMKRKAKEELVLFNDVISVSDHTHPVMEAVFSLSKPTGSFAASPLFPTCFKVSGFYTALYDNQYKVNRDKMFLSNKYISEIMFHKRNKRTDMLDENLLKLIEFKESNSMIVIHLFGQHYTYKDRYPKTFEKFTPEDYSKKYTTKQREYIAAYDNATLYNDYILEQIIQKIEGTNSILIYFSDHGEEVFDCRDFMGHGTAAHSPNLDYQIKIPFMVWTSEQYKKNYPQKIEAIKNARNLPIIISDFSHFLLDLADIKTEQLDYTRSFINEKYMAPNPRIVLHSVPYEQNSKEH